MKSLIFVVMVADLLQRIDVSRAAGDACANLNSFHGYNQIPPNQINPWIQL